MRRRHGTARAICLVAAAVVLATGCSPSTGAGDKAGGIGEPVVLTIAGGGAPYKPSLDEFIQKVSDLSGGKLRIDVVASPPGSELSAVAYIAAGKADLTTVGYRGFDGLGAGFRALLAPMLIDSPALEDAVLRSDIPATILADTASAGVIGLAILPGQGPMKPFATKHPLVALADWHAATFETYDSDTQAATIEALGGVPTDSSSPARDDGLRSGAIQGFSTGLNAYGINASEQLAPYVTINVNLWPGMQVLIGNPAVVARLSDTERGWLQQAARDVLSSSMVREDAGQLATLCQAGAQLSSASDVEIAALRAAVAPVYSQLEQNAETKLVIARVNSLKPSTLTDTPPAIPAGCGPKATGELPTDALSGTWTTAQLTQAEWVKAFITAGFSEKDAHLYAPVSGVDHYGQEILTFDHGHFTEQESVDGHDPVVANQGTYKVGPDGTFDLITGNIETYGYVVSGTTLSLHLVHVVCSGDCGPPIGPTLYGSFPFTRSN